MAVGAVLLLAIVDPLKGRGRGAMVTTSLSSAICQSATSSLAAGLPNVPAGPG